MGYCERQLQLYNILPLKAESLMSWRRKGPGQLQPRYWLFWTGQIRSPHVKGQLSKMVPGHVLEHLMHCILQLLIWCVSLQECYFVPIWHSVSNGGETPITDKKLNTIVVPMFRLNLCVLHSMPVNKRSKNTHAAVRSHFVNYALVY